MRVAVVILNFDGVSDTIDCLKSLKNVERSDFVLDTIVVDNGSRDDSVSRVKKEYPYVTVLANTQNLGYSEGNNVGIRYALKNEADFVLLLNNDTLVDKNLFTDLLTVAEDHKQGGIFGPKIYFAPGFETHKSRYHPKQEGKVFWYAGGKIDWANVLASHRGVDEVDTGQYDEMIKTSFVTGCAMFVRRRVFDTVGFFDKKFYLYYEDVDFCQRARSKGFDAYYVPKAHLWHKNAKSGGGTGSDLQVYYMTRNRLLIGMRYAPWRTRLALMREAMEVLMKGNKTQRQAVGDFLRKKYGNRETRSFGIPNINLLTFFKRTKKS